MKIIPYKILIKPHLQKISNPKKYSKSIKKDKSNIINIE